MGACFTVTAEGIQSTLHDLMLSGRWRVALEVCIDSELDYAIAAKLLEGAITLIDSDEGIVTNPVPNLEYQDELKWQRSGWCLFGDRLFQPVSVVMVTDPDLLPVRWAKGFRNEWGERQSEWHQSWMKRHGSDPDRTEVTETFDLIPGVAVLWQQLDNDCIPSWLPLRDLCTDPKTALKEYIECGHHLDRIQPTTFKRVIQSTAELRGDRVVPVIEVEPEPVIDDTAMYAALRARIREQNGDAWVTLTSEQGDTLQVPEKPFLNWVKKSLGSLGDGLVVPEWEPVCMSGVKMQNDDPVHSDWVIGAGLNPDIFYRGDWEKLAHEWACDYLDQVRPVKARQLRFNCVVFAGTGVVEGEVVFPEPDEPVKAGQIAVVPNGSQEYHIALMSACKGKQGAVISEVGGKLCHLAKVGRELDARFVMVKDALAQFRPGDRVRIDCDRQSVQVLKG